MCKNTLPKGRRFKEPLGSLPFRLVNQNKVRQIGIAWELPNFWPLKGKNNGKPEDGPNFEVAHQGNQPNSSPKIRYQGSKKKRTLNIPGNKIFRKKPPRNPTPRFFYGHFLKLISNWFNLYNIIITNPSSGSATIFPRVINSCLKCRESYLS